jgi:hypothetical protein
LVTRAAIMILSVVALPAITHAAESPRFVHIPPSEAKAGAPLVIEAHIDRAWRETTKLLYREIGDPSWRSATFERGTDPDSFSATIPAEMIRPPGLEYFVDGHFASATDPQRVMVYEDERTALQNSELERIHNRRARARVAFENVSYGPGDSYYRIDVDFTYRLLAFPLYSLRFGGSRLLQNGMDPKGYKEAGWFEVRLRLASLVDVDGRGIVAPTQTGVSVGGRVELRVGSENGAHVAGGIEGVQQAGYAAFLRLGWDTVPAFPMSTTIEVTNYPSSSSDPAVRLVYDIAHPLENGFRVGLRVGWQARNQQLGGLAAGVNLAYEF